MLSELPPSKFLLPLDSSAIDVVITASERRRKPLFNELNLNIPSLKKLAKPAEAKQELETYPANEAEFDKNDGLIYCPICYTDYETMPTDNFVYCENRLPDGRYLRHLICATCACNMIKLDTCPVCNQKQNLYKLDLDMARQILQSRAKAKILSEWKAQTINYILSFIYSNFQHRPFLDYINFNGIFVKEILEPLTRKIAQLPQAKRIQLDQQIRRIQSDMISEELYNLTREAVQQVFIATFHSKYGTENSHVLAKLTDQIFSFPSVAAAVVKIFRLFIRSFEEANTEDFIRGFNANDAPPFKIAHSTELENKLQEEKEKLEKVIKEIIESDVFIRKKVEIAREEPFYEENLQIKLEAETLILLKNYINEQKWDGTPPRRYQAFATSLITNIIRPGISALKVRYEAIKSDERITPELARLIPQLQI